MQFTGNVEYNTAWHGYILQKQNRGITALEWDKIKVAERSLPRDAIQCKPGCNRRWLQNYTDMYFMIYIKLM